jgi:SNF2 family DNA or RNA helicase
MHQFNFEPFEVGDLTTALILRHSSELPNTSQRGYFELQPQDIEVSFAEFTFAQASGSAVSVQVRLKIDSLKVGCNCSNVQNRLCEHQIQVLFNLINRKDLRIFFDTELRHREIRQAAIDYGLENVDIPDDHFVPEYANKEIKISPKVRELLPLNPATRERLHENLVPRNSSRIPIRTDQANEQSNIVVIGQHKYYDQFYIELYACSRTKDGKLKNPFTPVNPLDLIWKISDPDEIKFYSAVSRFHGNYRTKTGTDHDGLNAIIKNPGNLDFYHHNGQISENRNAASVTPILVKKQPAELTLHVDHRDDFFEIYGQLVLDGRSFNLEKLILIYEHFVLEDDVLHFVDDPDIIRIMTFFRGSNNRILIHQSKFESFRDEILSRIEKKVRIVYSYLKPASKEQLVEKGFDRPPERIIYLSDAGNHVTINPVMKYGDVEVSVFSLEILQGVDFRGHIFTVTRDQDAEIRFISAVVRTHPDFREQLGSQNFYLHKKSFLNNDWFLDAFDEWQQSGITVLGFNAVMDRKLNFHSASVSVQVSSGINWFNTTLNVKFGKQKATLKQLRKAAMNRTRFVQLDDGTTGLLPLAWVERLAKYFEAGEAMGEQLVTPKINFADLENLYPDESFLPEVRSELAHFRQRFQDFEAIPAVDIPDGLNATLRDYQKQGYNWLHFLDDFSFGGCLADDMGLGKTLQIITFLLSQRTKQKHNTNLIVVPTSLIFNWQNEIAKFAPSLTILTAYGATRPKDSADFGRYEIVLTTYGTLLGDISFLRKFTFNYIILDESQAIKNPESQRYRAVKLLKSRNKLLLTGTPVENNTFDLYGQLSFACPGLLGSKTYFRNHYAIPIDQFYDAERASELQKRINPFILRRTKKQVASELPEKTEMVLYCEMGEEQRRVYNAYEQEFRLFLNTKSEGDVARVQLHILQGLTKLRQICNSPSLLNDDAYYGNQSAKIDVLMEQITSKSANHKILIFSQFVTMLDLIKAKMQSANIAFEYLTGQTRNRQASVDNFQSNSDIRVFLISLKAGGTGLNLTEADYVYIVDPWWNPAVENQAIDRSYRIGQVKNVIAVKLICPDTIEEKILHLQESKKDLADALVKTDTAILKALTKQDLMELVGG